MVATNRGVVRALLVGCEPQRELQLQHFGPIGSEPIVVRPRTSRPKWLAHSVPLNTVAEDARRRPSQICWHHRPIDSESVSSPVQTSRIDGVCHAPLALLPFQYSTWCDV